MDLVRPADRETVEAMDGVYLTQLAVGERMSIQHLRMAPGARVPEHDHHHEQVGFVYEGTQTFVLEDGTVDVAAGQSYALGGGERHAAENRGDGVMRAIDVFGPPRRDPDWLE
jgi:mannose-6-phosphate isomerase-like protein (cupin superfamily)